ncbi:MAG: glycosyltransferase [Sedimenticola sp.]
MKIMHVVPTYWPAVRYGGPIWSVKYLCEALVRRGHQVEVVTTSVDGACDLDVPLGESVDVEGVSVRYFPSHFMRRLYYSRSMASYLGQEIKKIDFLHLHSIFLWPTLKAARLAESSGIPWCVAPRGALVPELVAAKSTMLKKAWLTLFERRTLQRASFIHATTELEVDDCRRFDYHLPRIEVVPNGVVMPASFDSIAWPERYRSFVSSGPVLLFLGRVNWKKGIDRLIDALAWMPSVRLIVAGNDEENLTPKLEKQAADLNVTDRLMFTGPVAGDEKHALLAKCSALVLPSYSENFGNVVLEAMAVGRPVAVTPEVGLARLVSENKVGVVIPGEPEMMGKTLVDFLDDNASLDIMGERGRRLVEERFTWDSVAEQMELAYLKYLDR